MIFGPSGLADIAVSLYDKSCLPDWTLYTRAEGYRPKEWGSMGISERVYCKTNIGGLFFDAIFSVSTSHTATITSHPVQNGANISDHMFVNPVTINMEIGMSDAMATMVQGQFTSAYSKSVSAYRELVKLQESRQPFTVLTRLNRYENMVIQGINVEDSAQYKNGLRASVNMQQIIMATVATEKVSTRNWTSGKGAKRGEVQPKQLPTSVAGQGDPNGTVNGSTTGQGG